MDEESKQRPNKSAKEGLKGGTVTPIGLSKTDGGDTKSGSKYNMVNPTVGQWGYTGDAAVSQESWKHAKAKL